MFIWFICISVWVVTSNRILTLWPSMTDELQTISRKICSLILAYHPMNIEREPIWIFIFIFCRYYTTTYQMVNWCQCVNIIIIAFFFFFLWWLPGLFWRITFGHLQRLFLPILQHFLMGIKFSFTGNISCQWIYGMQVFLFAYLLKILKTCDLSSIYEFIWMSLFIIFI